MSALRNLAILFAVCALALRVAMPTGWMPMVDAHGSVVLAPCPASQPVTVVHTGHHPDTGHDRVPSSKSAADCAFAPLQTAIDRWDPAAAVLPPAAERRPSRRWGR